MKKFLLTLVLGCLAISAAPAQTSYPDRAVRLIVPGSVGTITDILAREFAQSFSRVLQQPVIVENLVGADQLIGTQAAVRAKPDGYTILFVSSSTTVLDPVLRANLPYDVSKDLVAGCGVFKVGNVMNMSATLPFGTAADFIAAAKAEPEKYSFGYSTATTRLAGEMFQQEAGIRLLGVPYKGSAGGLTDVAAGLVHLFFIDTVSAEPHYRSGRIKPLLVAGNRRLKPIPTVPTAAEAGFPGYDIAPSAATWFPANTPPEILKAARAAIDAALRSPEYSAVLAKHSVDHYPVCGDDLTRSTAEEVARWEGIAQKAGIQKQ